MQSLHNFTKHNFNSGARDHSAQNFTVRAGMERYDPIKMAENARATL
jgi:hypothetical protein